MPDRRNPAEVTRPSQPAAPTLAIASEQIADGLERRLDSRFIDVERISHGILSAVLAGGSLLVLLVLLIGAAPGALPALGLGGAWLALCAGLAAMAYYWPAAKYRHISYRVDPKGLRIRRGVFWRSDLALPRSRVQHTDVSQGPIERGYGLATLIVHTAGTENASVSLSGLAAETAYAIRDFLIEGGEDDAV